MRFVLTIGIDVPGESSLTGALLDEDTDMADIVQDVIVEGFTAASDVSVLSCEVIDTDPDDE